MLSWLAVVFVVAVAASCSSQLGMTDPIPQDLGDPCHHGPQCGDRAGTGDGAGEPNLRAECASRGVNLDEVRDIIHFILHKSLFYYLVVGS